jgi:RNA polymerase sigma-70 factor (ECF subfamily)
MFTAPSQTEGIVQLEQAASMFARARPRLFGIAYRIVGNSADAEDVVQEVWIRWQTCDRGPVQAPAAFLSTTTARLAINTIQSARARHETYLNDSWHSSRSDGGANPEIEVEQREALESALVRLLETLSPAERAAYVLREAFQCPYQHIAELIQATEPATRQLVSRARKRVAAERRQPVETTECRRLLIAFLAAAQSGQLAVLEHLLTNNVVNSASRVAAHGAGRTSGRRRPRVLKFTRVAA